MFAMCLSFVLAVAGVVWRRLTNLAEAHTTLAISAQRPQHLQQHRQLFAHTNHRAKSVKMVSDIFAAGNIAKDTTCATSDEQANSRIDDDGEAKPPTPRHCTDDTLSERDTAGDI
jgi:hypothetical protein